MKEFSIGEVTYRTGPIDLFVQLKMGLKIAPLLNQAVGSVKDEALSLDAILGILSSAAPDDIDFVVTQCVASVQRREGQSWAAIYNRDSGRLMYEKILPIDLLKITVEVLEEKILPFYEGLVSMVLGPERTTPGS